MADGVEFIPWLENGLRAEGCPGVVASEQGLEFADDISPEVRLPPPCSRS